MLSTQVLYTISVFFALHQGHRNSLCLVKLILWPLLCRRFVYNSWNLVDTWNSQNKTNDIYDLLTPILNLRFNVVYGWTLQDDVVEDDRWIFYASCIHIATKFCPRGLHIILSQIKNKKSLIQFTHRHGTFSPLHLAASKIDCLSTG